MQQLSNFWQFQNFLILPIIYNPNLVEFDYAGMHGSWVSHASYLNPEYSTVVPNTANRSSAVQKVLSITDKRGCFLFSEDIIHILWLHSCYCLPENCWLFWCGRSGCRTWARRTGRTCRWCLPWRAPWPSRGRGGGRQQVAVPGLHLDPGLHPYPGGHGLQPHP